MITKSSLLITFLINYHNSVTAIYNLDNIDMAVPSAPIFLDSACLQELKADCYFEGHSHEFIADADVELLVEGRHVLPCHSVTLRLHSKVFDGLLRKDSLNISTSTKTGHCSCSSVLLLETFLCRLSRNFTLPPTHSLGASFCPVLGHTLWRMLSSLSIPLVANTHMEVSK